MKIELTPWGPPTAQTQVAPGIIVLTTARHGGVWLSGERVWQLPEVLRRVQTFAGGPWYEEDIDSIIPVLAFPTEFNGQAVWNAVDFVRSSPRNEQSETVAACAAFLESGCSLAHLALSKAEDWARTEAIADKWRTGGLSSHNGGWLVFLSRKGENREMIFRDYPVQQFYTDEELTALAVLVVSPAPAPPRRRNPAPDEGDYGGVFDGHQVTSDADPGL